MKLLNGVTPAAATYLHRDGLGSVRAITNAAGTKVEAALYKPFGEQSEWLLPGTPAPETKGWIGERFDADAGLQYLNARYYDPELALFLQPDWFEVTKAGVGTNRFSYSFNDPVNKLDPGGNQTIADPIPGPVWQDNALLGGGLILSAITYGAIMAGKPGVLVELPGIQSPPALPELQGPEGLTPSETQEPGIVSTPSGEFVGIGIVSTPASESPGLVLSTPDGTQIELPTVVESRGNIMGPDPNAIGAHTTIKRGPDGKITGYQEWTPNPLNPTGFDAGRRVDLSGKPHTNADGTVVPTPHVHEPKNKDVRPTEPDEVPKP